MLALQIAGGAYAELDKDASLTLTGSNPALDKDAVGRTFSYPFKLPASAANLALLRSNNRLDARNRRASDTKPAGTVWVGGSPMDTGVLTLLQASQEEVEVSFGNGALDMLTKMQDLKLRAVLETVEIPQPNDGHWVLTMNPSSPNFIVAINGFTYNASGATSTAGPALVAEINADYPDAAFYSSGSEALVLSSLAFDPFDVEINIGQVITLGFTIAEFRTVGMAREMNLREYLTDCLATPPASHDFPVLWAPVFYKLLNPLYCGYLNYAWEGVPGQNEGQEEPHSVYAYVPMLRVKYVLDRIAAATGIQAWGGDVYEAADFAELLMFNTRALDEFHRDFNTDTEEWEYTNTGVTEIDLNKHVPDWTCAEFFSRLCGALNLYPEQDGDTVYLRKRIDQLRQTPVDVTVQVSPAYAKEFVEEKQYYLDFEVDENAPLPLGQLGPYPSEATGDRVELPFAPLPNVTVRNDEENASWKMCHWRGYATSEPFDLETEYGFRLFFGRGEQVASDGNHYQMSTHDNESLVGSEIGEWSLALEGDAGLWLTWHKDWHRLRYAMPIEVQGVLTADQVRALLKWRNPLIYFFNPLGAVKAIVRDLSVTASQAGLSQTRLKLYRL